MAPYGSRPLADLLSELETDGHGLTREEAARRLKAHGPNEINSATGSLAVRELVALIVNPMVLVLISAAALSAAFGDVTNGLIILAIVVLSLVLDFAQTFRSQQASEALRRSVVVRVRVIREGAECEIPFREVVPGDLVVLGVGDVVPADARLLEARDLFVDEAPLTGESLPVEKETEAAEPEDRLVLAGTSVTSGTGKALAVLTGTRTAWGKIASELVRTPPPTEFERGMSEFAVMILRVTIALVLFVFLALAWIRHEPLEAFLFAIALAVGLTPEFLPMIVTVTLARGATLMAERRVIVKQLQAIENFGSMDVLCSDKTGTLTEGRLALSEALDPEGKPSEDVLAAGGIHGAYIRAMRNPMDEALAQACPAPRAEAACLDEIPFDFQRRRVSVVVREGDRARLVTKGAPESVLPTCTRWRRGGETPAFDEAAQQQVRGTFERLSEEGYRVVALAERSLEVRPTYSTGDERDLTLLGFVTFLDPPKPEAGEALRALATDGIRVVILTGDNEKVARHVCDAVGLGVERLMLGTELEGLSVDALAAAVEGVQVFARVSPDQKDQIVRALKHRHVVGFLGDGINDAPSLRVADVGISVDTGADVAKGAAAIILLDKSLAVLHEGVLEGRRCFANVAKYLMMGTSSNFGNMFSMAGAAAFLPFLPMLPTQILLNNLIYDASQLALPGDRVDADAVRRPRRWDIRDIQRFMFYMGPVSSIFDFLTFGLLLGIHAPPALFRTGWFVESILTQCLVVFVIRTEGNPFRSRSSVGLALNVAAACLVAAALPYTPLAPLLGFVRPPAWIMAALVALTAIYLTAAQGMKRLYSKGRRSQRCCPPRRGYAAEIGTRGSRPPGSGRPTRASWGKRRGCLPRSSPSLRDRARAPPCAPGSGAAPAP